MTKPLVERYEQILAQDPASTAFVELAKALLAKGDYARAIEVCQQGLGHHKDSVVGRVLWGKALIQLSRPAEAMEQFDQAISIDRDNPHAYNLIGEVLLHKGLYRSALPILRKAVALQPHDGRVRQWLEQTQRALTGQGPAPVVADPTLPDASALPPEEPTTAATQPIQTADLSKAAAEAVQEAEATAGDSGSVTAPNATRDLSGLTRVELHPAPALIAPAVTAPGDITDPAGASAGETTEPLGSTAGEATDPMGRAEAATRAQADAMEPGGSLPPPTNLQPKTVPSFAALMDGKPETAEPPEIAAREIPRLETITAPNVLLADLPTVALSQELLERMAEATPGMPAEPPRRELLEDLAPPEDEKLPIIAPRVPTEIREASAGLTRPPPLSSSGSKRRLLTEIPEQADLADSPLEIPKVELSASAAQALAQDYERELREKLAAKSKVENESFFSRHFRSVTAGVVAAVVLVAGSLVYLQTRAQNRGTDLKDALASARRALAQDTRSSYREALAPLAVAAKMAGNDAEVWALTAQAHALLLDEHGGSNENRALAEAALARPGVEAWNPGLTVALRYHLAPGAMRDTARRQVLDSKLNDAELHLLAGQLLAQKGGDTHVALERLKQAKEAAPTSIRPLVALGDYYREAGDCWRALPFYTAGAQLSPRHAPRAVGAAECRLELDMETADALKELEALPPDEELTPDVLAREQLARGRLLSALGRHPEAVKQLFEGARRFGERAYEFNLALGDARKAMGALEGAQNAYEAAAKARPRSEDARAAFGRMLVLRDREKDALAALADVDGRKAALVRGMALGRLGDWKHAWAELLKTHVNGKYPSEAAAYLALADVADGNEERAQEALERAVNGRKKVKSEVRVALGQVYWKRGAPDKARAQFAEAMKDPLDYEGACSLGRLLLSLDSREAALEPLSKAVARNPSHGEARHALGRAYLQLGRTAEALKQAEAWQLDNPGNAQAQRDFALVLHLSGKEKEADAAITRSLKLDADDVEAHRVQADILFAQGEAQDAIHALEAANKRDSRNAETFCAIGRAYLRSGKSAIAQKAFEAALKNDEQSVCGKVGVQLARLPGGARGAVKELVDLGKSAPDSWDRVRAQAVLARAHLALGEVQAARKAADSAVALDPLSGDAQLALGLVAAKQRDEPTARAALEKAVAREPSHGGAHLALGDLLAHSDTELERARKEYEAFQRSGGEPADQARVKRTLSTLKKRLATR